jgi:hypothetical protein
MNKKSGYTARGSQDRAGQPLFLLRGAGKM